MIEDLKKCPRCGEIPPHTNIVRTGWGTERKVAFQCLFCGHEGPTESETHLAITSWNSDRNCYKHESQFEAEIKRKKLVKEMRK